MSMQALSAGQSEEMNKILKLILDECEVSALAVCSLEGNIIAEQCREDAQSTENMAALAVGSFSATRELANMIGEPGFRSIFHRGQSSGILIEALGKEYLILVLFKDQTAHGMVRLYLKKVGSQLESILAGTDDQTAKKAGATSDFEVEAKADKAK